MGDTGAYGPMGAVAGRASAMLVVVTICGIAAAWVMCSMMGTLVIDPVTCIAAGYVLGLLCMQVAYLEFPHLEWRVPVLLAVTWFLVMAPCLLNERTCWKAEGGGLTWAAMGLWIADLAFVCLAYHWVIRGSFYRPAKACLKDKVCIVTGCNGGIGYETAKGLAVAGATVVFACRSEERARKAMAAMQKDHANIKEEQLKFIALDLASLQSVRKFVSHFVSTGLDLHLLVLNAGVMLRSRAISEDGVDMMVASNHLGHFLLTRLLLPRLLATESAECAKVAKQFKPRVVVLSSALSYLESALEFSDIVKVDDGKKHEFLARPYSLFHSYAQTKLANVMFGHELARRLRKDHASEIPVAVVHPGEVMTEVMRDFPAPIVLSYRLCRPVVWLLLKTARQGSKCTLYAATAPELATSQSPTASFYMRLRPVPPPLGSLEGGAARRLWDVSEQLAGLQESV